MSQFDPQQGSAGGAEPSDQDLEEYLVEHEGHTPEKAKQEVQHNKEAVKAKHKQHQQKQGSGGGQHGGPHTPGGHTPGR